MMKSNSTKLFILVGIFLLGSIIISQSGLFSQTRLDLTENKLFSLNDGTKNILNSIDETIHIKLYFSDEGTQNIPILRTYKNTVMDLLQEMKRYSHAKLEVTLIDPKIFSPQEDEASQYGLQALPVGSGGENIFFGLVGENSLDSVETIPFLQPDRETFLEYDIAQLINSLNNPEKKTIAILSSIPVNERYDEQKAEMLPSQIFVVQLQKDYKIRYIDAKAESIDDDIDVLMLIHPKELNQRMQYAIDQFVLNEGRLLVFVDPYAKAEIISQDPQDRLKSFQADKNSNLKKLFEAWDVSYDDKKIILDEKYALNLRRNQGERPVRHLEYFALDKSAFNNKDIVTRDLNTLNMATVGYFESDNLIPIITSSQVASTTTSEALKFLIDPNTLFKNYTPLGKKLTIAGRLKGTIKTAFPEGVKGVKLDKVLTQSSNPHVILFADIDVLFDQMWVSSQNFFGRKVFNAFADNGSLITNLMDNMAGSPDLINIRGRKNSARPFTKVIALQKASDKKFREQENVLKQRLRETEEKLNALQKNKGQQDRLIISKEQELEIKKFQKEKLEVRGKLREVRRSLDKDIHDLGSWLKMINIGLIPLVISLLGILMLWVKPKRKGGSYEK